MIRVIKLFSTKAMVYRDYVAEYRVFAQSVFQQYERQVALYGDFPVQKQLWLLDIAIHKMENELNSRMAEVHTQAEHASFFNNTSLDEQLTKIKKQTLKDFLVKQLDVVNKGKQTAKATVTR